MKSSTRSNFPSYPTLAALAVKLAGTVVFRQTRSFSKDAIAAFSGINPVPDIRGRENIPLSGPALITMNHFYRPGYHAWWSAIAISACVPYDIHWLMTGAFTFPHQRREVLLKPMSQWLLRAIAGVYGFTTVPAMPPDPLESAERATAIRQVVGFVRKNNQPVLGLAPEGRDILSGQLGDPPNGSGRFISYLTSLGLPVLPVGVYDTDGVLHVSFGSPYHLSVPKSLAMGDQDQAVGLVIMQAIGKQLPAQMRGIYA